MMAETFLSNLFAYSAQVACVIGIGGVAARAGRVHVPRVRYAFWRILLAICLVFWVWLLWRWVAPVRNDPDRRALINFFMIAAAAIPVFYLPALFFDGSTNYTVVDAWRFWIIHWWVEGFFELFVTVIVGILSYELGLVERITALRAIYLDVILVFGGGIIGTGHHWYFTGQTELNMALASAFSIPLTENFSRPLRPSDSAFSPSGYWSGRMPIIRRFERWIRS